MCFYSILSSFAYHEQCWNYIRITLSHCVPNEGKIKWNTHIYPRFLFLIKVLRGFGKHLLCFCVLLYIFCIFKSNYNTKLTLVGRTEWSQVGIFVSSYFYLIEKIFLEFIPEVVWNCTPLPLLRSQISASPCLRISPISPPPPPFEIFFSLKTLPTSTANWIQ